MMSFIETPLACATEVEAALIECPLKILVSTPASDRVSLIHLEIETGLTGL